MRLWTALSKLTADIFCNSLIETMLLLKHQTQFTKKKKKNAAYKEETEKVEKLRKQRKLHYLVTSTSLYGYLTKVANSCRGRQK